MVALLLDSRELALRGAPIEVRRPVHRLLMFTSVVTLALNTAAPLLAGEWGKAAFDAVGPLLLIGWADVGPELLQAMSPPFVERVPGPGDGSAKAGEPSGVDGLGKVRHVGSPRSTDAEFVEESNSAAYTQCRFHGRQPGLTIVWNRSTAGRRVTPLPARRLRLPHPAARDIPTSLCSSVRATPGGAGRRWPPRRPLAGRPCQVRRTAGGRCSPAACVRRGCLRRVRRVRR
jgi:hypothetical protein